MIDNLTEEQKSALPEIAYKILRNVTDTLIQKIGCGCDYKFGQRYPYKHSSLFSPQYDRDGNLIGFAVWLNDIDPKHHIMSESAVVIPLNYFDMDVDEATNLLFKDRFEYDYLSLEDLKRRRRWLDWIEEDYKRQKALDWQNKGLYEHEFQDS